MSAADDGPGKYDHLCTYVRKQAGADAAIVIVLRGKHGNGFSVQANGGLPDRVVAMLLRNVADEIDRESGPAH